MKTCCKCQQTKESSGFYKNKAMGDGLSHWCIQCRKTHEKAYRDTPSAKAIAKKRSRDWHINNKEKHEKSIKQWFTDNWDRYLELKKSWSKRNREKVAYYAATRRAAKRNRTPSWLSKEQLDKIKQFYITCPAGYHVDHIIPLKGENISGLHVPWNLQHLPATENIKKGNKFNGL